MLIFVQYLISILQPSFLKWEGLSAFLSTYGIISDSILCSMCNLYNKIGNSSWGIQNDFNVIKPEEKYLQIQNFCEAHKNVHWKIKLKFP